MADAHSAFRIPHSALEDRLTRRWIDFGRLLRRNGVAVTAGQVRDLLRALPLVDLKDRSEVYFASRAMLCARKEDLPKFDLAFRQFWGRTRQVIIPSDTGSLEERQPTTDDRRPPREQGWIETVKQRPILPIIERGVLSDMDNAGELEGEDEEENISQALLYSAQERLRKLDFARFTEDELTAARAVMMGWEWRPGLRRTRRMAPRKRGSRLDAPRTMRRAMRTEGVPYLLSWRGPRHKPRPLVFLCDISGSMAPYTRMMLHFLHILRREVGHAEVFVFGTRLTRITRQLKLRDVDAALAEVSSRVVDWSGGTRTGETLRAFNTKWGRRVLGQGAVVCIISDGWDRGDPDLLAAEIAHLQRTSFRLIWLNPLLGVSGYKPLTRGMVAALPYIDDFLPANNLDSLRTLADLLTSLDMGVRPARRQTLLGGRRPEDEGPRAAGPHFTVAPGRA
jgi:uncharacterized protein with von Willebrand factor type A (vWA) domain